jgi:hypothetical protein
MQMLLAIGRETHLHVTAVRATPPFDHKAKRFTAQDESDHPMMLRLQPFCELGDSGPIAARKAAKVQKQ